MLRFMLNTANLTWAINSKPVSHFKMDQDEGEREREKFPACAVESDEVLFALTGCALSYTSPVFQGPACFQGQISVCVCVSDNLRACV